LNVAVTAMAALTVTTQVPVPLHAPPQPPNVEPAAAVAVSVNCAPGVTDSEQSDPHEIPAGALVTVPVPRPFLVTVSVTGMRLNVAVTVVAAFTVTVQPAVPVQAPLQPANVEPAAGVAVSVNCVPGDTVSEQSLPHEMPAGALVTLPVPLPLRVTVSPTGAGLNVAVTVVAAFTVTAQVLVPLQAPLHPAKVEPPVPVAVSVNAVPGATVSEQSEPHEMPAGTLVTVPVPPPFLVTVRVTGVRLKVAVTVVAAFTVTAQVLVPLQPPPLQPVKVDPAAAAAVSVNAVPGVTVSEQSLPHEMPAGALVTVPVPVPFLASVSVTGAPVAEPVTARVIVSPLAVKLRLVAKVPPAVGANRTVTTWLAPAVSENEPPETTLYGAPTLTPPVMLVVLVFCTVNVRSTVVPVVMLPKLVVVVGVTLKSAWATPLAEGEHVLSLPVVSTAVIFTT
jgi:hypothetical protein